MNVVEDVAVERGEELRDYFDERRVRWVLPFFIPESIPGVVQYEPTFYQRFQGVLKGSVAREWKI